MESRLKWNKITLAAKTILFHFRRGYKNYFKEFQTRATAIGHHAKTMLLPRDAAMLARSWES